MRVSVTGATGFIGSAVIQNLIRAGHEVSGLARSKQSAGKLKAQGVRPYYGTIDEALRLAVAPHEGAAQRLRSSDAAREILEIIESRVAQRLPTVSGTGT